MQARLGSGLPVTRAQSFLGMSWLHSRCLRVSAMRRRGPGITAPPLAARIPPGSRANRKLTGARPTGLIPPWKPDSFQLADHAGVVWQQLESKCRGCHFYEQRAFAILLKIQLH
jgi:hypothetical protein